MRERERESNFFDGWGLSLTLFAVFIAIVGICLYVGFQNVANATPSSVKFNPVTIRNGAKIHVNGDKSLTAISGGSKLISDNTNGNKLEESQLSPSLSSFASSNYANDSFYTDGIVSKPQLLTIAELKTFGNYLLPVDNDYWLNDTANLGTISWRGYATSSNRLSNNQLTVTGRVDGVEYNKTEVASGSYAFNKTINPQSYTTTEGSRFSLNNTNVVEFPGCYVDTHLGNGEQVYNNPYCYSSGRDSFGNQYCSSTLQNLQNNTRRRIFGYVDSSGNVCKLKIGKTLKAGTVVVQGFDPSFNEISNPYGFKIASYSKWDSDWGPRLYVGFYKLLADTVLTREGSAGIQHLGGFSDYYETSETIRGVSISSSKKSVRPVYDTPSKVAFMRASESGDEIVTSPTLINEIGYYANYGDDKKFVIMSDTVKISESVSVNNVSTEKDFDKHALISYKDNVINVPYSAKELNFDSSAFSSINGKYISAVCNTNGSAKYGVLGKVDTKLKVNLSSILNTNKIGNSSTLSFYAEKTNGSNFSDLISDAPVTFEINVVEGAEQTLRFDNGGGIGNMPSNYTIKAGSSYVMPSGSDLSKDGNPFSCWEMTYIEYGESSETVRLVRENETLTIPDTNNGVIKISAIYGGIVAKKSTDSKSSVVTITWDTNAPDGFDSSGNLITARFDENLSGAFNEDRTKRYDKDKYGTGVMVPGAPIPSVSNIIFDGWYDSKTGGNKVTIGTNVTLKTSTTYYAHWIDGYRVTYNASDGDIPAKFILEDGKSLSSVDEVVLPGRTLNGPIVGSEIVEPTPIDTANPYAFIGWYTEPNGQGNKAEFGVTSVSKNTTYFAYFKNGYKITYDASGGKDASKTGSFILSDGKNVSTIYEIVQVGDKSQGPKDGDTAIDPVANDNKNEGFGFDGWYEASNGSGSIATVGEVITGNKVYYASYKSGNTFLAPESATANAKEIDPTKPKYTLNYVQRVARDIASKSSSSVYYSKFYKFMTDKNNCYHLYSLINNANEALPDSWIQSRIVNLGVIDSFSSGIMFQAVHMLPKAYQMQTSVGGTGNNWYGSALLVKMKRGGEIYRLFDTELSSRVLTYADAPFWVASHSQISGTSSTAIAAEGSQFAYYKVNGVGSGTSYKSDYLKMSGTRSGQEPTSIEDKYYWTRTRYYGGANGVNYAVIWTLSDYGYHSMYTIATEYQGVVPCFAL